MGSGNSCRGRRKPVVQENQAELVSASDQEPKNTVDTISTRQVQLDQKGTDNINSEGNDSNQKSATPQNTKETPDNDQQQNMEGQKSHTFTTAEREMSSEPKDVMISYSHQDKDFMRKMKEALEDAGITVWVDESNLTAGSEFLSKIGQAIIDCKVVLSLLTVSSITSRYCKDELALAYVSSKPIFPCALQEFDELMKHMDFGMRLQLAPVQWTMFTEDRPFKEAFKELYGSMESKLKQITGDDAAPPTLARAKSSRTRMNKFHRAESITDNDKDFWQENFGSKGEVPWEEFQEKLKSFIDKELKELELPKEWLVSVLAQEVDEDGDKIVDLRAYEDFIHVDGERIDFFTRIKEQALEMYTMHMVFNMESTVRLDAIHNLSKFRTDSVVEALLDLCADPDANVRTVAAVSLARASDKNNKRVVKKLISLLKDRDRLVRESGCLALGHIKATEAVGKLVNIWRNDFISTVREAAQIALENIGGEEASKAMHITKVLGAEIKSLAGSK